MSFQIKNFKTKLLSVSVAAIMLQQSGVVFAQAAEGEVDEIVVSGFRAAAKNAIDIKRNAGSVVDAISATDIGKLPDATITDSLQRVTGIQITRSGGEGTKVNIRGNGNVNTTLNGEQFLGAGSITNLQANFVDIPSTQISGIEVFKSAEAKNVVSGLGGTVNLKTNRPFLLKDGVTAVAKVEGAEGSLGKKTNGTLSGFLGYNNGGEFGATLNVSKGTSYLADYWNGAAGASAGNYAGWYFTASEKTGFVNKNVDVSGDGATNDTYWVPQGLQAGNRFIERERTGINGSVQYKINDAFELTGDAFYTKLNEHTYTANFVADQSWQKTTGWVTPDTGGSSGYADPSGTGTFYTVQSGVYQARSFASQTQTDAGNREALNTNIELAFDNGGPLTGTVRWVHAKALNDSQNGVIDSKITSGLTINDLYTPVKGAPTAANPWGYNGFDATLPDGTAVPNSFTQIPVHISYSGGKQIWQVPKVGLPITDANGKVVTVDEVLGSNLNRYSAKSSNVTGLYTNADLNVFRLDGAYKFDSALFDTVTSFDFGVRHGERNVVKDGWIGVVPKTNQYGDVYLARWKDSASSAPITGESYIPPISFTSLNQKGQIIGVSDFQGVQGLGTVYFVDPKALKDPLGWSVDTYGQHILLPDAPNSYNLNEVTKSAFVQANIERDLFGLPLKGNIGLRYLSTTNTVLQSTNGSGDIVYNGATFHSGPGADSTIGTQVTKDNTYSNFLPAINLALNVTDDKVVRFAFTKTIGGNDADALGKGLVVNKILACNVKDANGIAVFCASGGSQDGNPTLLPYLQNNLDISYEWYFSDNGLLSIGAFAVQGLVESKHDFVNRTDVADSDGVIRGYNPNTGQFVGYTQILSQINKSHKGGIGKGLEVGLKQAFDFLPGIWSGFGVDTNFTYSPSTGSDKDFYQKLLPGQDNSKYQSNLALWYEKDGLQARIAHNYRSKRFVADTHVGDYYLAYYQKPTSYVDASVSYEFYENITAALQITNLTQETQTYYNQWENNIDSQFYNERRTTLSLQAKF